MITLLSIATAAASPLNPWGSLAPEGTTTVAPYVYASASAVSSTLYASRGVHRLGDVYAGVGFVHESSGATRVLVEAFPRFGVGSQTAIVPHVVWGSAAADRSAGAEIHTWGGKGPLSWVVNLMWRTPLDPQAPSPGTLSAALAPEVSLTERVSMFIEVDPSIALETSATDVLVVQGASVVLGSERAHTAVVALQWSPEAGPSVGASWTTTFPTRE